MTFNKSQSKSITYRFTIQFLLKLIYYSIFIRKIIDSRINIKPSVT